MPSINSLLNAYSLPSAICNKHGELYETSKDFNKLWPLDRERNIQAMFFQQDRWESDWRLVLRNRTIELLETRLCEPLSQYMLKTSRVEQQNTNDPLFLIELHPRKQLTGGFIKLASYYTQSQRQKHRSHLATLKMRKAIKESHTDPLTEIANRRAFDEYLEDVWQRAIQDRRSVVLFTADIDYFKMVNDQLGHSRGDEILIQIAKCFDLLLSRDHDMVARVGGEEFSMILPDTQSDGGQVMACSVVAAIAKLGIPHPSSLSAEGVTISLGCSSIQPGPNDNLNELIEAADKALYFSKNSGRNCASYMDMKKQSLAIIHP